MKEVIVLSGKGGTGKTTITGSLAYWLENKILVDADVDASNLPLLLEPQIERQEDFFSGFEALKDPSLCNKCGICIKKCRFQAIRDDLSIDPLECEGCGVCAWFCPQKAIKMKEKRAGKIFWAHTPYGPLIYAKLVPGEENSGRLVAQVKKYAQDKAKKEKKAYILVDGSPGIGCPVIASLSGAEEAILVTEPTLSAWHDLKRIFDLIQHFKIKAYIIINKSNLNKKLTLKIKKNLEKEGWPLLGEIPYDEEVFGALQKGQPLPKISKGPAVKALEKIFLKLKEEVFV